MEKVEEKKEEKINTSANTGDIKNTGNDTERHKSELLKEEEDKKEQERTRVKKELFLNIFAKTLGSVTASCDKIGIERKTYYRWRNDDENFAMAINNCWARKLDDVEQQLNKKILSGDTSAIRYFLDRRHPSYMPKLKVITPNEGERSMESILKDCEWADNNEQYEIKTEDEQDIDDPKLLQNKEQEGTNGIVQTERSADVLLDEKKKEEPSTESKTEGDK